MKFAQLETNDHFYFIDQLLRLKKNPCKKTGDHFYRDADGDHHIRRTWRPVYGPVTFVEKTKD